MAAFASAFCLVSTSITYGSFAPAKFARPHRIVWSGINVAGLRVNLSRLGSFHQSKRSFLRSFLQEFKNWEYKRDLLDLDENGFGVVIYSFKKKNIIYSLICFANKISDK